MTKADFSQFASLDAIYEHIEQGGGLAQITGVDLFQPRLSPDQLTTLLDDVLPALTSLSSVCLSRVLLQPGQIASLCQRVAAVGWNRCPWLRIALPRCNLHSHGVIQLFTALKGNAVMEVVEVGGNHCTDEAMVAVADFLTYHASKLTSLDLSNNLITGEGMLTLATAVGRASCKLIHLSLRGNGKLFTSSATTSTAVPADRFFMSLIQRQRLQYLNISACGLSAHVDSLRYLCFLSTLYRLDLSHNQLTDDDLVKVCVCVSRLPALAVLDLSYNAFTGTHCGNLEELLAQNQSLKTLDLRGHYVKPLFWSWICAGLRSSKSMLSLDLGDCALEEESLLPWLTNVFAANDIVSVHLQNNPLPQRCINDPRGYCMERQPATTILPLALDAEVRSIRSGNAWRQKRWEEMEMAVQAQAVLISGSDETFAVDKCWELTAAVEQCPLFITTTQLQHCVDVARKAYMTHEMEVIICYGRSSIELGVVKLSSSTYYSKLRQIVQPLVQEYIGEAQGADELIVFSFLDASGALINDREEKVRLVLKDISDQELPRIVLRPAIWMDFTHQNDGDEE